MLFYFFKKAFLKEESIQIFQKAGKSANVLDLA